MDRSDSRPHNLGVILGSTRSGRFGPTVGRWLVEQVEARDDFAVDVIDLADHDLPAALGSPASSGVAAYVRRLERADAFVVVTPEYNHGYPASLKQAIDIAYEPWQAKPVAFVSYGGMSGGLRAVEQLRQVFAEVHAVTVRDCVSFHNPWTQFDDGALTREPTAAEAAAKVMLDRLAWWTGALRTARDARPYAA